MPADGYRINELPSYLVYTSTLANDDKFPYYLAEFDKTVWMNVSTFRTWVLSGGGGTITPIISGNKIIHDVTLAEHGGTTVNLPDLAGKLFNLEIDGRDFIPAEYSILSGGGFQITIPDYALAEGQRCTLELYEFAVTGGTTTPSSGGSLFRGSLPITANYTMSALNDAGKLLQFRGLSSSYKLTLALVEELPVNSVVVIEASIQNTKQHEIATQSGQLIYMNGTSWTSVYIGPGEVVWLFVGEDGYYVINDFAKIYRELLTPFISLDPTEQIGEAFLDGSEDLRATYPRAFQKIQALGAGYITEANWQLAAVYRQGNTYTTSVPGSGSYETIPFPNRGKFSAGTDTTTNTKFRWPKWEGMTVRGLISGTDNERYSNTAGNYQKFMTELHDHGQPIESGGGTNRQSLVTNANSDEGISETDRTGTFGGAETRMDNIGIYWKIKV
jgi:hypothetical protein